MRRAAFGGFVLLAALAALLLPASAARAANYQSAQNHFSFVIPQGWQKLPAEAARSAGKGIGGAGQSFEVGYFKSGATFGGETPFMFAEFVPARMSLDAIESELKDASKKSSSRIKSGTVDRARNLVTIEYADGVQRMRTITYGFVGKNGITNLHCTAPKATFESDLAAFQGFANSFAYDAGHEYQRGATKTVGRGAGIGLLVLGGAWVLRKMRSAAA